jgi:hypothetical protein
MLVTKAHQDAKMSPCITKEKLNSFEYYTRTPYTKFYITPNTDLTKFLIPTIAKLTIRKEENKF